MSISRTIGPSIPRARLHTLERRIIVALTSIALALGRVLLCPGSLCLVDELLLALVLVL